MTDYYVSTAGSDNNTGLSEAQAWLTIQKAANSVSAGDTVHVLAGTYEKVTISRSGTVSSPIVFQGEGMPTITYTGAGSASGPVIISGSYITITGFKIIAKDTVYGISIFSGIVISHLTGPTNLNISNNYIKTDSGYGICVFGSNINPTLKGGSNSIIYNNEIHTGHYAGIVFISAIAIQENIEITYNTIYADENKEHRDSTAASGMWTYYGLTRNLNISHNKILHSAYTAIKIAGSGHKINYNEIGPDGFAHNCIETIMRDSEIIGNYIHDTNSSWVLHSNIFYPAGMGEYKNLIIRDNIVENSSGQALVTGSPQRNVLVENFTVKDFVGRGINVMGYRHPDFQSPVFSSDNLMFVNVSLINFSATNDSPMLFIRSGTILSDGVTWTRDNNTFINPKITGTYTRPTWWLLNQDAHAIDHRFEGTIHAINSNKDDALFTKLEPGTHNGEIIFYYYTDVQVVDKNGNPVDGAKVSFIANDPTMKAKNVNYTYEPFPGKTQDIDYTFTKVDGHTPLPSYASETISIADFKQTLTGKTFYTWTITAEKFGATNTTTISPDITWYRDDPNIPVINSKIQIQLPIEITNGAVIGKVTDSSGIPIKDVNIDINGTIVLTDTNGDYGLGDLLPGTYNMLISKTGYVSTTDEFVITTNEVITKNFTLSQQCPEPICHINISSI